MNIRTSTRAVFCVVLFASSFVVARGPSQHAAEPETVLVSVNNAGTDSGNGNSNAFEPGPAIYIPAISAN